MQLAAEDVRGPADGDHRGDEGDEVAESHPGHGAHRRVEPALDARERDGDDARVELAHARPDADGRDGVARGAGSGPHPARASRLGPQMSQQRHRAHAHDATVAVRVEEVKEVLTMHSIICAYGQPAPRHVPRGRRRGILHGRRGRARDQPARRLPGRRRARARPRRAPVPPARALGAPDGRRRRAVRARAARGARRGRGARGRRRGARPARGPPRARVPPDARRVAAGPSRRDLPPRVPGRHDQPARPRRHDRRARARAIGPLRLGIVGDVRDTELASSP